MSFIQNASPLLVFIVSSLCHCRPCRANIFQNGQFSKEDVISANSLESGSLRLANGKPEPVIKVRNLETTSKVVNADERQPVLFELNAHPWLNMAFSIFPGIWATRCSPVLTNVKLCVIGRPR